MNHLLVVSCGSQVLVYISQTFMFSQVFIGVCIALEVCLLKVPSSALVRLHLSTFPDLKPYTLLCDVRMKFHPRHK